MSKLKFKTNLKCSGCIAAVTPHIENVKGLNKWDVDLAAADKTLSVEGDGIEQEVVAALSTAGYTAERIG